MAGHWVAQNDPVNAIGRQLHVPGFVGTSAQRQAYGVGTLQTSDEWYETDTGMTWQWTGTAWGLWGSSIGGNSLVFAGAQSLQTGQTLGLATGVYEAII
jgi:hypothetical protein